MFNSYVTLPEGRCVIDDQFISNQILWWEQNIVSVEPRTSIQAWLPNSLDLIGPIKQYDDRCVLNSQRPSVFLWLLGFNVWFLMCFSISVLCVLWCLILAHEFYSCFHTWSLKRTRPTSGAWQALIVGLDFCSSRNTRLVYFWYTSDI